MSLLFFVFAAGLIVPFIQLFSYILGAWRLFGGRELNWHTVYYPYSFGMAVLFLFLMAMAYKGKKALPWENMYKYIAAGIQAAIGGFVWMAAKEVLFHKMVFCLLWAMTIIMLTFFMRRQADRTLGYTIALVAGEMAVFSQPLVKISQTYVVEWYCFFIGIGIVILGILWYDKRQEIRMIKFPLTCAVPIVMLFNNLAAGVVLILLAIRI